MSDGASTVFFVWHYIDPKSMARYGPWVRESEARAKIERLQAKLAAADALVATAYEDARERCAEIAENRYKSWTDGSGVKCDATACAEIAAAIREDTE